MAIIVDLIMLSNGNEMDAAHKAAEVWLNIEVVYASPQRQLVVPLTLKAPVTAGEAILSSGIARQFPELDLARATIGIFGCVVDAQVLLREGDRVEIYRPLLADPKAVRRARAARRRQA